MTIDKPFEYKNWGAKWEALMAANNPVSGRSAGAASR